MITEEAQAVLQDLDDHKFAKVKEAVRDMHYADAGGAAVWRPVVMG